MTFTRREIDEAKAHPDQSIDGPWRKVFVDILTRAKKGDNLTFAEQESIYIGLNASAIDNENPKDLKSCDDYRFVYTFLTYAPDLNGASLLKDYKGRPISITQKQHDIEELNKFADTWEAVISKHNHKDFALNIISKEAREEIKLLDNDPEFYTYGFFRQCNLYDAKRKRIVLHSKFVYCKYQEIFQELAQGQNVFQLNGQDIEFTEFSYIHILFGHYAEIIKQTEKIDKSYHNEDFHPNTLIRTLRDIIQTIDSSKVYIGQAIDKLSFNYKNTTYRVYINQRYKQVKSIGNVPYYRLETFYPIKDQGQSQDLIDNYNLVSLNDDLKLYIRK